MGTRGRPRDQAARERIITAATELFPRDGYLATTIGAIAERAEVAVKTIYAAYGSKLGVLAAAHDRAVVGTDESIPLLDQEWARSLQHAATVDSAWTAAVDQLAVSTDRVARVLTAAHAAAADPDVAELLAGLQDQRHAFSLDLARTLLSLPGAAPSAPVEQVADVLYATLSVESYRLFVTERRWSVQAWRDWAHQTVAPHLVSAVDEPATPAK